MLNRCMFAKEVNHRDLRPSYDMWSTTRLPAESHAELGWISTVSLNSKIPGNAGIDSGPAYLSIRWMYKFNLGQYGGGESCREPGTQYTECRMLVLRLQTLLETDSHAASCL
jgi:hypothetical protein